MGKIIKHKESGFIYQNKRFDSKEEIYFSWYVSELLDKGFIKKAIYQPHSFILSDHEKYKSK